MKKNWIALASLALNLVLVALVLWQGSRLDTLEQSLWNVQDNLMDRQDQVMDEMGALRQDVQEGGAAHRRLRPGARRAGPGDPLRPAERLCDAEGVER